jgi:Thiopurine S-methyltransferase (TPMT)
MKGAHQIARAIKVANSPISRKVSLRYNCRAQRPAVTESTPSSSSWRCFSSSPSDSAPLPHPPPPSTAVLAEDTNAPKSESKPESIHEIRSERRANDTSTGADTLGVSATTITVDTTTTTSATKPAAAGAAAATTSIDSTSINDAKADAHDDDDFGAEFDDYLPSPSVVSSSSPSSPSLYEDYKLHPGLPPVDDAFLFGNKENEKNLTMDERYARYRRAYYHGKTFVEAWATVWASGQTPFDLGRPTPALAEALERKDMKFINILVPGFGTGHDLVTLARCNPGAAILGVEISGGAMYKAEEVLRKAYTAREVTEARVDLICGDFFDDREWDIYYDFAPENFTAEALQKQKEDEEEMNRKYKDGGWTDAEDEDNDKKKEDLKKDWEDDEDETVKDESAKNEDAAAKDDAAKEESGAKDESEKGKDEDATNDESVAKDEGATAKDEEKITTGESHNGSNGTAASSISKTTTPIPDKLAKQEPEIGDDNPKTVDPPLEDEMKNLLDQFTPKTDGGGKDGGQQDEKIPVGFDLIYDYGFFSSLPKRVRLQYAERMCEMLTPNTGRLLTIMYPIDDIGCTGPMEGPPFRATLQDYRTLFEPLGVVMDGEPYESPDTVPSRVGEEWICWWRRGETPPKPPTEKKVPHKKKGDWIDEDTEFDFELEPKTIDDEEEPEPTSLSSAFKNLKRGF